MKILYKSKGPLITVGIPVFNDEKYIGAGGYFFETISHYGGKTVQEETNYECTDNHLGESGHRVQSELFYNYIKK